MGVGCRKGLDLSSQVAGQIVVLRQDAVYQRRVPAFDLALGHRMIWSPAGIRSRSWASGHFGEVVGNG